MLYGRPFFHCVAVGPAVEKLARQLMYSRKRSREESIQRMVSRTGTADVLSMILPSQSANTAEAKGPSRHELQDLATKAWGKKRAGSRGVKVVQNPRNWRMFSSSSRLFRLNACLKQPGRGMNLGFNQSRGSPTLLASSTFIQRLQKPKILRSTHLQCSVCRIDVQKERELGRLTAHDRWCSHPFRRCDNHTSCQHRLVFVAEPEKLLRATWP